MLVVNLFGVPGSGKSTGAAYIFSRLKMAGINAELITEFAKDKVWEGNDTIFEPDNQLYLFGKQFYRMSRCRDKVDALVTDSPLPLCAFYNKSDTLGQGFNILVWNVFNSFDNYNVLLERVKPYQEKGRLQTEAESNAMLGPLTHCLDCGPIQYEKIPGDSIGYEKVIATAMHRMGKDPLSNLQQFWKDNCPFVQE